MGQRLIRTIGVLVLALGISATASAAELKVQADGQNLKAGFTTKVAAEILVTKDGKSFGWNDPSPAGQTTHVSVSLWQGCMYKIEGPYYYGNGHYAVFLTPCANPAGSKQIFRVTAGNAADTDGGSALLVLTTN